MSFFSISSLAACNSLLSINLEKAESNRDSLFTVVNDLAMTIPLVDADYLQLASLVFDTYDNYSII